jgi:hypothetical protein
MEPLMRAVPLPNGLAVGALLVLGMIAAQPAAQAAEPGLTSTPVTSLQEPQLGPALQGAVPNAVAPLKTLRLDPMADSSADPLSNGVALQPDRPGDVPVSTALLTDGLSHGGGLDSLPLVGTVSHVLPG